MLTDVRVMMLCDKGCKLAHLDLKNNKYRRQKQSLPAHEMLLRAEEYVYC